MCLENNKKELNTGKGFTLIETLVAISILLTAVVAPMVFIANDTAAVLGTKDKIIALYLAEDAIDFVKYRIATNFNDTSVTSWIQDIPTNCTGSGPGGDGFCIVSSFINEITVCGFTCPPLGFDPASGVYLYTGSLPSKFTREVAIRWPNQDPYPPERPQEMIIDVIVRWDDRGKTKQVALSEHMFSWGK